MSARKSKPGPGVIGEYVVLGRFRGSGRIKTPTGKQLPEHVSLKDALAEAQRLAISTKSAAAVFRQMFSVPPPAEPKPVVLRKPRPGPLRTKLTPPADAPESGRKVIVEVRRRRGKPVQKEI